MADPERWYDVIDESGRACKMLVRLTEEGIVAEQYPTVGGQNETPPTWAVTAQELSEGFLSERRL